MRRSEPSRSDDGVVDAARGELDRGNDVLALEIRHLVEYLLEGQPTGEQIQDIGGSNPHPSNARSSAALVRIERDPSFDLGHHDLTSIADVR